VTDPSVGVQDDQAHLFDGRPVRLELLRGPAARGGESDGVRRRGLHLDREGELAAESYEVEAEGARRPDHQERGLLHFSKYGPVDGIEGARVSIDGLRVSLKELLEFALVGRGGPSHAPKSRPG
jgi:hypothetical protein